MKLYLMRHGQAAHPLQDPQQGLTTTGAAEIDRLAQLLAHKGVAVAQVFHSGKLRAQQTAEIMAQHLAPDCDPQELAGLKPNDEPQDLLPIIDTWDKDTLIASHLPFIPNLLVLLTRAQQSDTFVPGTVFCLSRAGNAWGIEWQVQP